MLIGARFIQGVGGALASAVILGMIVTMFPEPREQAKAIGVYGFVASAGGSIGLLAGGVLTQAISWHWIFLDQPADRDRDGLRWRCGWSRRDRDRPQRGRRHPRRGADHRLADARRLHDPRRSAEHGWGSTQTLALGAVSLALLAAFIARQARIANPLMPLRLFRSRNVAGANAIQALLVAGMFGMFFLGALYLQRVLGYDALEVGLAFLPATIVMGTLSLGFSERLIMRFGPRTTLIPGVVADRGRAAALRPHAGRRQLPDRPAAADAADRRRRGHRLPVADDAGDVGGDAERLGAGLGPGQHQHAGRRRDRPRRAGDARRPSAPTPARQRRLQAAALNSRLPPRLPGRSRRWSGSRSASPSSCCAPEAPREGDGARRGGGRAGLLRGELSPVALAGLPRARAYPRCRAARHRSRPGGARGGRP